jgi:tRNA1Val (adenine37-N6)-methyltransferase
LLLFYFILFSLILLEHPQLTFMSNPAFAFKKFTVRQDRCAMKVGTDAVLLGAWAEVKNAQRILDIGTGTGVIALMMAQRSNAFVDAIDIDANSCTQAVDNIGQSIWSDRIKVQQTSLQQFASISQLRYDLIVSNPPYFIDSSKALGVERTTARHADQLPYCEMMAGVLKLLHKDGRLCVILPVKEAEVFRELAGKGKLKLSKLTRVRTHADKSQEKRWLMQYEYNPTSFSEDFLIIEKDARHTYSEEYRLLTKDFYLAF